MTIQFPPEEQVRRQKARYGRYVDTKQFDLLDTVLHPDLHFRMIAADGTVLASYENRDAFMADMRAFLEGAQSIHQIHNDEIDRVSDTEVSAIWSMEDVIHFPKGRSDKLARMQGYGHYHETWRLGAEGWRVTDIELRRTIHEFVLASE